MMRQSTYHQLLHGTLLCILAQLPYVAPVVVMPSAVGQAAMGSGIKHHAHTQLLTCKRVLSRVGDREAILLRDSVQVVGQQRRKCSQWEGIAEYRRRIAKDEWKEPGWAEAYQSNLTDAQLTEKVSVACSAFHAAESKVESQLKTLRASGALPPEPPAEGGIESMLVRACVYGRASSHLYEYRPRVSLMLQYFKRPWVVSRFVERVATCSTEQLPLELLVNVDSPQDAALWVNASEATKGLVVPVISANIHEIRAYNRLAHIARGDFLVVMADDDFPPQDCGWLTNIARIFERWPEVGLLGIRRQQLCYKHDHYKHILFRDPLTGLRAQWVQRVDMAPMALRRIAFLNVGGFDENLSEPGECGILSDWELCHRMWVAGWQVMATTPVKMESDGRAGGTHKPETGVRCWKKQLTVAGSVMGTRQKTPIEDDMCDVVKALNLNQLVLVNDTECPWAQEGGCGAGEALKAMSKAGLHLHMGHPDLMSQSSANANASVGDGRRQEAGAASRGTVRGRAKGLGGKGQGGAVR